MWGLQIATPKGVEKLEFVMIFKNKPYISSSALREKQHVFLQHQCLLH
jgi:hypothetical protein